ncbi:hypothetical protein AAEO50_19360 [Rossellomorea oryzaecorticis]|uniref:Uncharacterized protein n=1 Tax=Rossellomorea oryzaecorticis TaxID=1396505 RepID=A0ABU9KFU1_9BACI
MTELCLMLNLYPADVTIISGKEKETPLSKVPLLIIFHFFAYSYER